MGNDAKSDVLLRRPEVEKLTGRARSSLYADISAGRMPSPIRIGPRAVAWLKSDIDAWLAQRVAERAAERDLVVADE